MMILRVTFTNNIRTNEETSRRLHREMIKYTTRIRTRTLMRFLRTNRNMLYVISLITLFRRLCAGIKTRRALNLRNIPRTPLRVQTKGKGRLFRALSLRNISINLGN